MWKFDIKSLKSLYSILDKYEVKRIRDYNRLERGVDKNGKVKRLPKRRKQ